MKVQIPSDVMKNYRVVELGRVFDPRKKKFQRRWEVRHRDMPIFVTNTKKESLDFLRSHCMRRTYAF
jgi:hypothetical protein